MKKKERKKGRVEGIVPSETRSKWARVFARAAKPVPRGHAVSRDVVSNRRDFSKVGLIDCGLSRRFV